MQKKHKECDKVRICTYARMHVCTVYRAIAGYSTLEASMSKSVYTPTAEGTSIPYVQYVLPTTCSAYCLPTYLTVR